MADRDAGQLVEYAPRSKRELARTSQALNLRQPPAGVTVAQPMSSAIWSHVETRTKRGKARTTSIQVTDGLVLAGLGVLFLYEVDKAVSAWAGNLGADLAGLNPLNWVTNGLNAASAMDSIKSAASAVAQAASAPPVASSPGVSGSNVGQVVDRRLGGGALGSLLSGLWTDVREHKLEIPPTG